jgi:predicted oxidoreductase
MQSKIPKNTKEHHWTMHSLEKMKYYGLSAQKILGVIRRPTRKEEGIVEKTVAVMQPVSPKIVNGKNIWKQEIWVMYQGGQQKTKNKGESANRKIQELQKQIGATSRIKIISAWRYPGVSPERNPIPEEILREIEESCV